MVKKNIYSNYKKMDFLESLEEKRKKKLEYMKEYRLTHPRKDECKKYYSNNSIEIKRKYYERYHNDDEYRENKLEYNRQYKKKNTYKCDRLRRIGTWRLRGVKGDLETIHDEIYMKTNYCMVCKKHVEGYNKHLDHDHITGNFRFILCCSCNVKDCWKKKIGNSLL